MFARRFRKSHVHGALLGCSALLFGSAVIAAANQPQQSELETRLIAADNVSSHVPDQREQSSRAPINTRAANAAPVADWWSPGEKRPMLAYKEYANDYGRVAVLNTDGQIDTKGHPFFEPLSKNGRACISCHQPVDGMSLSVPTIQQQWKLTGGKDPIFAAVDGMNCPSQPAGDPKSHSLLLERGLFRIFLPWPAKDAKGKAIDPEFTIEVVRDPTGCNTSSKYGLASANPMISVYRRPRVMANMKYITAGGGLFNIKDGSLMLKDPETGKPVSMQLMADGREATLKTQAIGASASHLQLSGKLTPAQLQKIQAFQMQVYTAQVFSKDGGSLTTNAPTALGVRAVADGEFGLGDNFKTPAFGDYEVWKKPQPGETPKQRAFRESVVRGHDVFFVRPFWIRDVTHLNTVGLGNPIKRTCATCHNAKYIGNDIAPGWMDLGTTNMPWAKVAANVAQGRAPFAHAYDKAIENASQPSSADRSAELPLFKLTCKASASPHPFLGRVIYTSDPGRALITGRCADIGAITMQQMRSLAARAPYFSNGSARTLRELVDYYDLRFDARYSEQEKQDLVNFLSVL